MGYKSYENLCSDIRNNIAKIPHDIDLVVGVPRSGLLVANIIALTLNKPITDVDGLITGRIISNGSTKNNRNSVTSVDECKKVLVVEDSVWSGSSISINRKRIESSGLKCQIVYFAAYVYPGKEGLVDIFLEIIDTPRLFEWNLFHHSILEQACMDIDGVLCEDPTEEENDDGSNYLNFITNATPKYIPSQRVKYIVSSRLEKYRNETEKWLQKYNVVYDELFLLDSTAEERRKLGLHAKFKAEVYKNSKCVLFIESSPQQADYISKQTGKYVFCTDNNHLYKSQGIKTRKERIYSFIYPYVKKMKSIINLVNSRRSV